MALNLKTFGIRTLSAIVFVVVLLGSVILNYYSFSIFFMLIALIGLKEFYALSEKMEALPFKNFGYLLGIATYLSFVNRVYLFSGVSSYSELSLGLLISIPFIILSFAVFAKQPNPIRNAVFTMAGIFYAVLPMSMLHKLVFMNGTDSTNSVYYPNILLGVIFLIWSNDTFAYLGGSFFGKNKMIERISPGKTWEGTIFGILISFGISFLIQAFVDDVSGINWPLLGIAVPILATLGDLIESMLKRQAQVKDSGNVMPGHGGVLDRFDSMILVSPIITAYLMILKLN